MMRTPSYINDLRSDIQPSYKDSLVHYGIKGMRWGVRRYQDENGRLTRAGKKRRKLLNQKADRGEDLVAKGKTTAGEATKSFAKGSAGLIGTLSTGNPIPYAVGVIAGEKNRINREDIALARMRYTKPDDFKRAIVDKKFLKKKVRQDFNV